MIMFILLFFSVYYIQCEYFNNIYQSVDRIVYVFWTGVNDMSINRKRCLESIYKNIGVEVRLITFYNLADYVKQDYPLHEAYQYLSETHKSDYLRTYFMHHYGGGYTDIKNTTTDWTPFFESLENSDNLANGYTEIAGGSASNDPMITEGGYKDCIGNGGYIFKNYTKLTKEWIDELNRKCSFHYENLKKNPSSGPQDVLNSTLYTKESSKYPLAWAELLGAHFHDIIYKYKNRLLHEMKILDSSDYR